MDPHLNDILMYSLMTVSYVVILFSIRQTTILGFDTIHPIFVGCFIATLGCLFIAGIYFVAQHHYVPQIPKLIIGSFLFLTALVVFIDVRAHLAIVLTMSSLIIATAIFSGIGARYLYKIITLNKIYLYIFLNFLISFIIHYFRDRR